MYVQLCSKCSHLTLNITVSFGLNLCLAAMFLSKKLIYYISNTLQIYPISSFLSTFIYIFFVSLHSHSGQVLMPKQPLTPCTCPWVPTSIAVATVFLQVLTQSNQCGAQTGTIWSQYTPRKLEEDSGHPSHAVICWLQGDGPYFKGGIGKAHELRQEGVRAAKVLVAAVCGWVVIMWGRGPSSGAGIVVGV